VALGRRPYRGAGDGGGAFGNDPVRLFGAPALDSLLHGAGVFVREAIGMQRF